MLIGGKTLKEIAEMPGIGAAPKFIREHGFPEFGMPVETTEDGRLGLWRVTVHCEKSMNKTYQVEATSDSEAEKAAIAMAEDDDDWDDIEVEDVEKIEGSDQ